MGEGQNNPAIMEHILGLGRAVRGKIKGCCCACVARDGLRRGGRRSRLRPSLTSGALFPVATCPTFRSLRDVDAGVAPPPLSSFVSSTEGKFFALVAVGASESGPRPSIEQ